MDGLTLYRPFDSLADVSYVCRACEKAMALVCAGESVGIFPVYFLACSNAECGRYGDLTLAAVQTSPSPVEGAEA